jgi:hypothetical protein
MYVLQCPEQKRDRIEWHIVNYKFERRNLFRFLLFLEFFYEPNCITAIDRLLRRTRIRSVILIIKFTVIHSCIEHFQSSALLN